MTTSDSQSKSIAALHALYVSLGGSEIPLNYHRIWAWTEWEKDGNTADDLKLVMADIDRWNRAKPDYKRSKSFDRIVVDTNHFAKLKAEAESEQRRIQASKRAPAHGPRERILEQTGRKSYTDAPVQTPEQIMRGNKAFEQFRKAKEAL